MSFLSILGGVGRVVGSFFGIQSGGTPSNQPSAFSKIADVADEYKYTPEEQAHDEMARYVQDSGDTARLMQSAERPGQAPFDIIVDGINRLQRPAWGAYFFGAFAGWWKLPDLSTFQSAAYWGTIFTIYFTALFGGRAIFKDLSKSIVEILERVKK